MTTNEYSADCEIPRIFMITISRFYPHTCPNIKCLQPQIMTSEYILPDGSIQHSALGDNWSALGSLWSIIEILTFIRTAYSGQEYPPFESTAQMSLNPPQEMTSFLTSVDDMSSLSPPRRPLGAFNGRHLLSQYELTGSPSQVADTQMFEGILARLPSTRPSSLFSRIPVAAIQAQDEMTSVDGRSVVSSDTYIYPHIGTVNSQQYHDIAQFSYDSSGDRFDEMDLQTAYDK